MSKNYTTRHDRITKIWQIIASDEKSTDVIGSFGYEISARHFTVLMNDLDIARHMEEIISDNLKVMNDSTRLRLLKGAEIAIRGGVYPLPHNTRHELAIIDNGKGDEYRLKEVGGDPFTIYCPCLDYVKAPILGVNNQRTCKHIVAYTYSIREQLQTEYPVISEELSISIVLAKANIAGLEELVKTMEAIQGRISQANLNRLEQKVEKFRGSNGDVKISFPLDIAKIEEETFPLPI